MTGRDSKIVLRLILITFIILLSGCSTPPEVSEVRDVIISHFENRGYSVTELEIGKIEDIPLRDREYMSTKGHLVKIRSITLRPAEQKAGDATSFSEAVIEIHRSQDERMGWLISRITGIPVK